MSHAQSTVERLYDLGSLSNAGAEIAIEPTDEERAAIARWAEIIGVESFRAKITLERPAPDRFSYAAHLAADIVQSCVVTLDPVRSHIEREVIRELHLVPRRRGTGAAQTLTLDDSEDDTPEDIDNPRYDLAAPLLEEFSLAIDPYPRAPGMVFESPEDGQRPPSPFAVLKTLKPGEGSA